MEEQEPEVEVTEETEVEQQETLPQSKKVDARPEEESKKPRVCITGITGYLGSWVLKTFLDHDNYIIRATARDPKNHEKMKHLKGYFESSKNGYKEKFDRVELVAADLTDAKSLEKAIEGCDYVVHTASPFPAKNPKNEDEVVKPAVDGTRAVLEACAKHKVKKLVLTSSIVAILDYDSDKDMFNEDDWLKITNRTIAYPKSKTLAEQESYDFIENLPEDQKFDCVRINPGFILGPLLFSTSCTSQEILSKILLGKFPGIPDIYMPIVDVRDVAVAHYIAIDQDWAHDRYCLVEGNYHFATIGRTLNREYRKFGYKPSKNKLPFCTAKLASFFVPEAKLIMPQWGKNKKIDNARVIEDMKIEFISQYNSITEMAESLMDLKLVRDKRK